MFCLRALRFSRVGVGSGVVAVALVTGFASATAFASEGRGPAVSVGMTGDFAFHACPAGTPAADRCLTDQVTGTLPGVGAVTGTFEVHLAASEVAPDQCEPIDKHGAFTTAGGLRVVLGAEGMFCAGQGIASYDYRVVGGGTGRGQWLVPAPDVFDGSTGSGAEFFFGSLRVAGR